VPPFGAAFAGSAGDDCNSSIIREPLILLVVMPLGASLSPRGASPSIILMGILFRTDAPRAWLSDDERVGVVVLASREEPSSVGVGVNVVVAETFTGGEVAATDLVGDGFLTIGSEGGFHIGPLGGTAYRLHEYRSLSFITRSYFFFPFNLRDPRLDALQFLPRKRVIGLDLDHF